MKRVIYEYGLVICAVLTVGVIFSIMTMWFNEDSRWSFRNVFKSQMAYQDDIEKLEQTNPVTAKTGGMQLDEKAGIVSVFDNKNLPRFRSSLSDNVTNHSLSGNGVVTFSGAAGADELRSLFGQDIEVSTSGAVGTFSTVADCVESDLVLVITKYEPDGALGMSGTAGGTLWNGVYTEEVLYTDEFGNTFELGGKTHTEQIGYTITSVYVRFDGEKGIYATDTGLPVDFSINYNMGTQFKVVYRYTKPTVEDSYKAEYTAMFVVNIQSATTVYEEVLKSFLGDAYDGADATHP